MSHSFYSYWGNKNNCTFDGSNPISSVEDCFKGMKEWINTYQPDVVFYETPQLKHYGNSFRYTKENGFFLDVSKVEEIQIYDLNLITENEFLYEIEDFIKNVDFLKVDKKEKYPKILTIKGILYDKKEFLSTIDQHIKEKGEHTLLGSRDIILNSFYDKKKPVCLIFSEKPSRIDKSKFIKL